MLHKSRTIGLISIAFAVTVLVGYARPFSLLPGDQQGVMASAAVSGSSPASLVGQSAQRKGARAKNIEQQPEAVKLSRRIGGQRFNSEVTQVLLLQGELSVGTERQQIQIARRSGAKGEKVEVAFAGKASAVAWDETDERLSRNSKLSLSERQVLERLVFDSADQFILAQLRGASYYIVARSVRPDEAPDDYAGPLWDVVRVDEPEAEESERPRWRLYYLNRGTGLIDRIVSESQGDQIEAHLSNWTSQAGELVPLAITWTRQGQTLMSLNLTTVTLAAQ